MPIVTSQILKTVDFIKAQKFRYLENKTLVLLKKKKEVLITHQGLLYSKNGFVAEVIFKPMLAFKIHFIFYFYLLNHLYNFHYSDLLSFNHQPCSLINDVS